MSQLFLFISSFNADDFNHFANKELLPLMPEVKPKSAAFESIEHIRPYHYYEADGLYDTSHRVCVRFRAEGLTTNKKHIYIFEISLGKLIQGRFPACYFESVHILDSGYHPFNISFRSEDSIIDLVGEFLKMDEKGSYLSRKSSNIESQNEHRQAGEWLANNIQIAEHDTSCERCQEDPCCCSDPDPG